MSSNILIKFLRIGTLAAPVLLPYIVIPWVLFPFMFGKVLFLYFFVCLLFVPYVALCVHSLEFRERVRTVCHLTLTRVLFVLLIVDCITSLFGVDFDRSFFGDEERGTSLLFSLMLFIWYFMTTSVWHMKDDGRTFVRWIAGSGIGIVAIALLRYFGITIFGVDTGFRISGTIANAIFFAGAMVWYLFFALGAYSFAINKKEKYVWASAALLFFLALLMAQTRGAYLGFAVGAFFGILLFTILRKGTIRKYAMGVIFGMIIAVIFFIMLRTSFQNSPWSPLRRIANISLNESTLVTRFAAWKSGFEAFKERPMVGWGQENFSSAFDKHYNPKLLNAGYAETRFDRAHNAFIDRLVMGGIAGFFAFFIVWVAAFSMVWQLRNTNQLFTVTGISVIIAHLLHLFFAFDTPSTLILVYAFFVLLGNQKSEIRNQYLTHSRIGTLWLLGIIPVAALVYILVYAPLSANEALLRATVISLDVSREKAIPFYERAVAMRTIFPEEFRVEYTKNIVRWIAGEHPVSDVARSAVRRSDVLLQENISRHPLYSYYPYLLGTLYKEATYLDESYKEKALAQFSHALLLSPCRQQYYFAKAEVYNSKRDFTRALEAYEQAFNCAPEVWLSQWYKGVTLFVLGKKEEAEKLLVKLAEEKKIPASEDEQRLMAHTLDELGRYDLSIEYYLNLVERDVYNADRWAQLATVFAKLKEYGNAMAAATQAAKLDPTFNAEAQRFIATLPQENALQKITRKKFIEYLEEANRQ